MILLELALKAGLNPYKVSSTQGGEYKSSCPICGGKDRFFIQPNRQMKLCVGYYQCRQCDCKGDAIQFAIDFFGMNFKDAAQHVNAQIIKKQFYIHTPRKIIPIPAQINSISNAWRTKAATLVAWAHKNIWHQKEILETLHKRGLPSEAVRTYKIGWCPADILTKKSNWGIKDDTKINLWIPQGIVIPSCENNGNVQRIKIRRSAWKSGDPIGKYIALSGSMGGLTIIGNTKKDLMIVVESELDAYALHYAVNDFAFVVAVGSNIKNPDNITDFLANKKSILLCYDNDNAGQNMYHKWKRLYPHVHPYPVPIGKDIGESVKQGFNIRPWIVRYKWAKTPQEKLINFILNYINKQTAAGKFYKDLEKEIFMGPSSLRAKTGELQDGLKLMKELISPDE